MIENAKSIICKETTNIHLFIISTGRPQPQVSWFMNGILVDEEYEHNSGNVIENRLLWPSLQRHDLYSVFMCRASNTKAVAPKERRLVLDMYCKYLCDVITIEFSLIIHFHYFPSQQTKTLRQ